MQWRYFISHTGAHVPGHDDESSAGCLCYRVRHLHSHLQTYRIQTETKESKQTQ